MTGNNADNDLENSNLTLKDQNMAEVWGEYTFKDYTFVY